jgi:drug/metabolite transporter (DMT)-like permease
VHLNNIAGIACLCVGLMFFAVQDAVLKTLVDDYSVLQLLFMRSLASAPLLAAFLLWRHGIGGFATSRPLLHLVRCLLTVTAFTCFYLAVGAVALVDVVALFNAAPLFITAFAGPVLGERVGWRRWCAVAVGFVGVLVMLQPGSAGFNPVVLLGLVAALSYSVSALIARTMGPAESSVLMAFFSNLTFLLVCGSSLLVLRALRTGASFALPDIALLRPYLAPVGMDLALMLCAGLITITGFVLVPRAYQLAPASVVSPFEYTYLLWALIIGMLFFDEIPNAASLTGAALIVTAGVYIARREARLAPSDGVSAGPQAK